MVTDQLFYRQRLLIFYLYVIAHQEKGCVRVLNVEQLYLKTQLKSQKEFASFPAKKNPFFMMFSKQLLQTKLSLVTKQIISHQLTFG